MKRSPKGLKPIKVSTRAIEQGATSYKKTEARGRRHDHKKYSPKKTEEKMAVLTHITAILGQ
jgi:hypothetical protein